MGYVPGTRIDLSYLNKKPVRVGATSAGQFLFDVGTKLTFRFVEGRMVAARHIPVSFA